MTRKYTILVFGWSISVDKDENFAGDIAKDIGKELLEKLINKLNKNRTQCFFIALLLPCCLFFASKKYSLSKYFIVFCMKNLE